MEVAGYILTNGIMLGIGWTKDKQCGFAKFEVFLLLFAISFSWDI